MIEAHALEQISKASPGESVTLVVQWAMPSGLLRDVAHLSRDQRVQFLDRATADLKRNVLAALVATPYAEVQDLAGMTEAIVTAPRSTWEVLVGETGALHRKDVHVLANAQISLP
jgi:hypothetical protein